MGAHHKVKKSMNVMCPKRLPTKEQYSVICQRVHHQLLARVCPSVQCSQSSHGLEQWQMLRKHAQRNPNTQICRALAHRRVEIHDLTLWSLFPDIFIMIHLYICIFRNVLVCLLIYILIHINIHISVHWYVCMYMYVSIYIYNSIVACVYISCV